MVAGILGALQATFEIGQSALQYWSSVGGTIKLRSRFWFGQRRVTVRARIVFRNRALLVREHVDPKPLSRLQMRMRSRLMVHAHQNQKRIERHRRKRVRRHALDRAFMVHGDDGHPGGEASHGAAELFLLCVHSAEQSFTTNTAFPLLGRFRYHSVEFGRERLPVLVENSNSTGLIPAAAGAELRSPLSRESAIRWIRTPDEELPELLSAAQSARDRFRPGVITYSRKVFIPLTNLCRDYCGYCTFRRDPGLPGAHTMTPNEVLAVSRAGEKLGCTEALFSLGDKPELIFPEMRETLRQLGFRSTLHYLEAMCELVLRETSLLPHPNPGLMSAEWISRLAAVSPSMGLMLETTNDALLARGAAHDNAPDKIPARRLRTIEEAGKQGVPFTTGILIGIGESPDDRVDALLAIRDLHLRYGHIQEVIIQNFRVKSGIPMHHWAEPSRAEMLRTVAVARLLMPGVNIQAPPNLSDPDYENLLDAGINDWGGVSPLTPDFINPERPWPHLEQLKLRTEAKGFKLRQRLPIYPEFIEQAMHNSVLLDAKLNAAVSRQGYAWSAA